MTFVAVPLDTDLGSTLTDAAGACPPSSFHAGKLDRYRARQARQSQRAPAADVDRETALKGLSLSLQLSFLEEYPCSKSVEKMTGTQRKTVKETRA